MDAFPEKASASAKKSPKPAPKAAAKTPVKDAGKPTGKSPETKAVAAKPPEKPSAVLEPFVGPGVSGESTAGIPDPSAPRGDAEVGSVAKAFCAAIADEVTQSRTAYQLKRINELETQLRTRLTEFEAKRAELQKTIDKQEELRKKAEDGVIAIFSRMRPESAASQLSIMDDSVAAALLGKLNPRTASSILNEISPAKAARIADAMTGAAAPGRN